MLASTDITTCAALLARLSDWNDAEAWRSFVERYRPLILSFARARGLNGADAEEIADEVLARIVVGIGTLAYDPDKGRFRGWLDTLVRNACVDRLRKLARTPGGIGSGYEDAARQLEMEVESEPYSGLAEVLSERMQADLKKLDDVLRTVTQAVTPQSWTIYWRSDILHESPAEIASQMQLPIRTVYGAIHRVRKKLLEEGAKAKLDDGPPPS
jgi:RNA polymerase sigma-70 factor (ECF subfamily)